MSAGRIAVLLETTPQRTFASALDWPGWCRSGKTADLAIEALAAYVDRYRAAIRGSNLPLPGAVSEPDLAVVEQIEGNATTAFGAPGVIAEADRTPADQAAFARVATIVAAAWATFDRVAASAPAELRKGPRGGGRDTAKIVEHVAGADDAYARAIGIRVPDRDPRDRSPVIRRRVAVLDVLGRPSDGGPLDNRWPQRYAARRIAWHALDHAWEIEDRSER